MPLPSSTCSDPPTLAAAPQEPMEPSVGEFFERRGRQTAPPRHSGSTTSSDRRQFGNSHRGLSEAGRELAQAIDRYKLENHRRYITCDEMLTILGELGYERPRTVSPASSDPETT